MSYPQHQTYPRRRRIWPGAAVAAALAFCLGSVVFAIGRTVTDQPDTTPATTTRPPNQPTTPAAKAAQVTLGAGTWEVGTEVKPGTYTTTANGHCYWARLKNFDGELASIAANDNLADGQRGRLTVKKTDKGLELSGDCVWSVAK